MRHLALAFVLVGCAAAARATLGPRYGGEIKVGVSAVPPSLEPQAASRASERLVNALVHETLVRVGGDGLLAPALAERWTAAVDGREWRLSLAPNLVFHDGRPVLPEDAVRALRRFVKSSSMAAALFARSIEGGAAFRSGATEELPGVTATEGREIVLRFPTPVASPLAPLASPAAAVVGANGAGCGPFLPTVRIPGRSLSLTAFAGHVRGRPFLDRIQVQATAEGSRNDFDVVSGDPGVAAASAVLLLVLDPARPPFDQLAARTAVAAAVDRADLARLTAGGDAAATLVPPFLLAPLSRAPGRRVAPPPGPRDIVMAVDRSIRPLLSQRVVAHLQSLGFNVQAVPVEPAAAPVAPAQARLLLYVPEVAEAGLALHEVLAFTPPVPAAAEILEQATTERDADRRRGLLYRVEELLVTHAAVVPLGVLPVTASTRPGVHGLTVDPAGRILLEDSWLEP